MCPPALLTCEPAPPLAPPLFPLPLFCPVVRRELAGFEVPDADCCVLFGVDDAIAESLIR